MLKSASINRCVYQRCGSTFSPGEELDNSIAQELQSLVVIDPRGGEETGGEVGRSEERQTLGKHTNRKSKILNVGLLHVLYFNFITETLHYVNFSNNWKNVGVEKLLTGSAHTLTHMHTHSAAHLISALRITAAHIQ